MIDHELHARWRDRLEDQRTSGLSIAAWCRQHHIPDHQFYYWKKKFSPKDQGEQVVEWVPVVSTDIDKPESAHRDHGITISVGTVSIAVQPGFNEALLLDVIRVLQAC